MDDLAGKIQETLPRGDPDCIAEKIAEALRLVAEANRSLGVSAYQLHVLANKLEE